MSDQLPKTTERKILGKATALQIFNITAKGKTLSIAGCKVTDGSLHGNMKFAVVRDGVEIFVGESDSLKHNKDDILKADKGSEC